MAPPRDKPNSDLPALRSIPKIASADPGTKPDIVDPDVADVNLIELGITLAARHIILQALLDTSISRKDRAEMGLRAISTFEGTTKKLWIKDETKVTRTHEEVKKDSARLTKRLKGLIAKQEHLTDKRKAADTAIQLAESQGEVGEA